MRERSLQFAQELVIPPLQFRRPPFPPFQVPECGCGQAELRGGFLLSHPHRLAHLRELGAFRRGAVGVRVHEHVVHLPRYVALQAADRLPPGLPLGGPPRHVPPRPLVVCHALDRDLVERPVRLPVAAAVEPVTFRLPARRGDRGGAAHHRERRLALQPAGVVAGGHDQGGGGRGAAALDAEQRGRVRLQQRADALVEGLDLAAGLLPDRRDGPQRGQHALLERVARLPPAREQRHEVLRPLAAPEPLPQGARGRREHRLRAGHAGRGRRDGQPARDVELAHRLDPAVLRLRHGAALPGRRLARRALGVQRVALPLAGPHLVPLGPEHLDDVVPELHEPPRQPGPVRCRALDADDHAAPRVAYRLRQPVVALGVGPEAPAPDLPPEAVEQAQDMHVLVRVDARDDRFAFHFRSPRSAACSAPGSPRHCTDGSATIQLACPIVRAHAPIRSWQDSGTRMPGRDRSDLRTAEEASAGQWVIVPAFSIRVALRRGNRAPLPRPAVPASPENNYQCR